MLSSKTALLIIDIQNDYFENGRMPVEDALDASLNARLVLEKFRKLYLPVFHVQHVATRAGATFLIANTKGIEIHDNVKPSNNEQIIIKHFPNSFRETPLLDYLKLSEISDLIICGMMTHMCIDATTRAAKDFGFKCTIIGDACATRTLEINGEKVEAKEVQKAFLSALNYFYASVIKTEEFVNHSIREFKS